MVQCKSDNTNNLCHFTGRNATWTTSQDVHQLQVQVLPFVHAYKFGHGQRWVMGISGNRAQRSGCFSRNGAFPDQSMQFVQRNINATSSQDFPEVGNNTIEEWSIPRTKHLAHWDNQIVGKDIGECHSHIWMIRHTPKGSFNIISMNQNRTCRFCDPHTENLNAN